MSRSWTRSRTWWEFSPPETCSLALARGKKTVRVGEMMTRDPVTVTPDTPAHEAIALLLEHRFGSLPVIGTDGHLMGIVTDTDFLAAARDVFSPR